MLTNFYLWKGPGPFQAKVDFIHNMPFLPILEAIIILPILFHGIYGLVIATGSSPNVIAYPYADNWRYTLQRISGVVAFVFIIFHLVHFRFAHWFGMTKFIPEQAFDSTVYGLVNPAMRAWYLVGVVAVVYHFANGIWTFLITWGITAGPKSQRIFKYVVVPIGLALLGLGVFSLLGAARAAKAAAESDATYVMLNMLCG